MDADEPHAARTIGELLADTVAALRDEDQTDAALLDILQNHILNMLPANDAVQRAANEIELLAARRGELSEEPID